MKKITLLLLLAVSYASAIELNLTGSVVSDNQKMITSRYMGIVKKMNVSEGEIVKKGQLLYQIDSKEIDSKKEQVELGISQAQLALQMNKNQETNVLLNLGRYQRLFKKGMVSKYELENLQLAAKNMKDMVKISQKQIAQARAMKKEVMNQYNYLKLKAPNDGVIIMKTLNVGEMAIPGMPGVVLTDLSKLSIIVEISETNLKHIELGKNVAVEIPSIDFATMGSISSIIPSSNPMTHKFKMKIKFNKKGKSIYPGMYAKVNIKD
ncbi:efflux RND transporter periplasmic adaptor subunit [Sulfurovum sp. bin170]|uniref:efflux RND transporter periplasmic adaptor subunit n=1 Tax=Sulfurovum sp. bin170 TaxID=2695268 RepID=UPI0013DE9314|nr:efflux RND transporter periplasmic adaptor subunit [Sulfurovum sp. bin170]NEW60405.1 efflux RND transporter periplasmic adaptor subunit [Sulfurovum sp. bin170]